MIEIDSIRKKLEARLTPARYEHTISVSFTCMALAMRYGYDLEKAELAGLLHDCAKRYDDHKIIKKCEKHGIALTDSELRSPAVIHAKLGAFLAERKFGVSDPEILSAIACHTTGKPQMGLLDKILYVADYIEPRRDKAPGLTDMRRLAFEELDEALYQILKGTLAYLERSGHFADEMTQKAFEACEELRRGKEEPLAENEDTKGKEDASADDGSKGISKNSRKGHRRKKRRKH